MPSSFPLHTVYHSSRASDVPPLYATQNPDPNSTHIPKLQILITSGAHLSRYLVQLAIHHHFRSYVPFIKTPWVRSMSTTSFVHLMSVAAKRYGNMPTIKGDDDGTIFSEFLRESRYPTEQKHVKWEEVRDILEKYEVSRLVRLPRHVSQIHSAIWSKFIPFCNKVNSENLPTVGPP